MLPTIHKRIRVYLLQPTDRPNYKAEWVEPVTGKRRSRSLKTDDGRLAELRRADLEYELNHETYARPEVASNPPAASARPERPRAGFVYLALAGDLYKIGWAVNVPRRLAEVQIGSPVTMTCVLTIRSDDAVWLEVLFHRHFADRRVRGEWFALTSADLDLLRGIDVWDRETGPGRIVRAADPFATRSESGHSDGLSGDHFGEQYEG